MKFIMIFAYLIITGCAPLPFEALEGTSLEFCHTSSVGKLGADVKVVSTKEKVKTCSYIEKVSVEKCKGFRGDKISYIEILRNQTGFRGGNILFIDSSSTPVTKGEAFLCSQKVYDEI